MIPLKMLIKCFDALLDELDALAGKMEGDAADTLEDLNAELEDALMLLSTVKPEEDAEELVGILEDMQALAEDYRAVAVSNPELLSTAERLATAVNDAMETAESLS